jgi:hypothetical protein
MTAIQDENRLSTRAASRFTRPATSTRFAEISVDLVRFTGLIPLV